MTEAGYIGIISPVLSHDWTDNVPSYYSYYEFHQKRKAAKKQLKKERRIFCALSFLLICVCMFCLSLNTQSKETYVSCPTHAVVYGETLWSIANEYKDDDMTTGEYVYEIKKANDLTSSNISAGDVLVLP